MSYQNPECTIGSSFNVFGEGTFRYVDYETFDWSENGSILEKLTNEGWIEVSHEETLRISRLIIKRIIKKQ